MKSGERKQVTRKAVNEKMGETEKCEEKDFREHEGAARSPWRVTAEGGARGRGGGSMDAHEQQMTWLKDGWGSGMANQWEYGCGGSGKFEFFGVG